MGICTVQKKMAKHDLCLAEDSFPLTGVISHIR